MVKRISAAVLVISVILSMMVIPVSAVDYDTNLAFSEYLTQHFKNFETEIDITKYVTKNKWTLAEAMDEFLDVVYDTPELYYVNVTAKGSRIGNMYIIRDVSYICKKSELADYTKKIDAAAKKAMATTNKSMTDYEVILALHDYMIMNVRYDSKTASMANGYDALVLGSATCQGYARGYAYLLSYAGFENMVVREKSGKMNHGWNLVKIGNNWYHSDTTKDDPISNNIDSFGRVAHKYVLCSDKAMKAAEFTWDTEKYPAATKTTYDKRAWVGVRSAFTKIGDDWYYIKIDETKSASNHKDQDPNNKKTYANLYKYNFATNKSTKVYSFESTWYGWGTENLAKTKRYNENYSSLCQYNGKLYFNTSKVIYSYDPTTKKVAKVYTPEKLNGYIYGMNMVANKITYTVKQEPATAKESLKSVKVTAATATKVALEKKTLSGKVGKTYTVKATLTPSTSKDFIYWESSNTAVATVDITGKIVCNKAGTATISAYTAKGAKASVKITVTE